MFGPQLVVEERSHQDWKLLDVAGELDMATAEQLHDALSALAGSKVIIDMVDVTFIDSVGLRTLLRARQDFGEESLHVVAPEGPVRRLLQLTQLEGSFSVSDTLP
ncbi:MAG TPA: STAS domain-containing protein [Acidimicrobiia bacterium]|nr:STAS domain-containing protein [Acidimicrobiia bacterium]